MLTPRPVLFAPISVSKVGLRIIDSARDSAREHNLVYVVVQDPLDLLLPIIVLRITDVLPTDIHFDLFWRVEDIAEYFVNVLYDPANLKRDGVQLLLDEPFFLDRDFLDCDQRKLHDFNW